MYVFEPCDRGVVYTSLCLAIAIGNIPSLYSMSSSQAVYFLSRISLLLNRPIPINALFRLAIP